MEVSQEPQKKKAPPRPPDGGGTASQKSKPIRRRRQRSELDRLLSDEGTRNMLKGLKHVKKQPNVFRGRVAEVRGGVRARGFRKPLVKQRKIVRRESVEGSRSPSSSLKIDHKFVSVVKRGNVGFVTIVGGGTESGGKSEEEEEVKRISGAWGVKILQSLDSAIRTLEQDSAISVILVQNSHSRYFCNGIDLSEVIGQSADRGTKISNLVKSIKSLISTLLVTRKLLVASVSGDCVGFGVMLLPLFDLVYANDKSSFRAHYNALGQLPEGISLFGGLLRGGGAGKITSLLYLNTPLTPTEALQSGLIHEILWPSRYQEDLHVRLQSLSNQSSLVCASKAIVRAYRRTVKIADLNVELTGIEETWGSGEFQDVARSLSSAGDYDSWTWKKKKEITTNGDSRRSEPTTVVQ